MPHALRVFKCLRIAGFTEQQALGIAAVVESSRDDGAIFNRDAMIEIICDAAWPEEAAEVFADTIRNCFRTQRFALHFDRKALKFRFVRSKLPVVAVEAFLDCIEGCAMTPTQAEIRHSIKHQLSPGRVVMCDFRHLAKPEMQKERRAIVVSARTANFTGRCAVVPVSKKRSWEANPAHFEFAPGTYPFFHRDDPVWAICDHIYTVSTDRLWMVNVGKNPKSDAAISAQHLRAIRNLLGTVLGVMN